MSRRLLFTDDDNFAFNTARVLNAGVYGGSDIGEVVTTADRITPEDFDSWHDEWLRTADRVAAEADRSLAGGHEVSARDGFLRASNYYRAAHFFLHGNAGDPRTAHAGRRSTECFKQAASLFEPQIEPVEIPYEGTTLPGYFYPGTGGPGRRPVLLLFTGFDGTAEEQYCSGAAAAAERGYRVLVFEGPGQGNAILERGLPFRGDWEKVVGPVIDYVVQRDDVDASRIALMGQSLGGVLAPRAAAFEKRIAAVIAHDGIYDFARAVAAAIPRDEAMINQARANVPLFRWLFGHGMWVTATSTPLEFLDALEMFTVADGVAEQITCPVLVCDDLDPRIAGQPQQLYDHLAAPKTFLHFTAEEGADDHCQSGALRLALARIYDWLDDTFANLPVREAQGATNPIVRRPATDAS